MRCVCVFDGLLNNVSGSITCLRPSILIVSVIKVIGFDIISIVICVCIFLFILESSMFRLNTKRFDD